MKIVLQFHSTNLLFSSLYQNSIFLLFTKILFFFSLPKFYFSSIQSLPKFYFLLFTKILFFFSLPKFYFSSLQSLPNFFFLLFTKIYFSSLQSLPKFYFFSLYQNFIFLLFTKILFFFSLPKFYFSSLYQILFFLSLPKFYFSSLYQNFHLQTVLPRSELAPTIALKSSSCFSLHDLSEMEHTEGGTHHQLPCLLDGK